MSHLQVAIMVEGQNGLNWPRWQNLATAVEELGFAGLYRSDHYTNARPPDKDALELWVSLTWLADHTRRIAFGPLVSPVSFRHPTMTARMARDVDDLSGGRLTLGLGAGWQAREHENYGWDLLDVESRFRRFEEGLEVITRLLRQPEPVDFEGQFFRLKEATLLPRPKRPQGPPILIGGNGVRRTLPLAARYADEWNGVFLTPEAFRQRCQILDDLLQAEGRAPGELRRSTMVGCVYGRDDAEVDSKAAIYRRPAEELLESGLVVGTASAVVEQLGHLAEAGAESVMLQWLELDDLDRLEHLAGAVLPQLTG